MPRLLRAALYLAVWLAVGWVLLRLYDVPPPPEDLSD